MTVHKIALPVFLLLLLVFSPVVAQSDHYEQIFGASTTYINGIEVDNLIAFQVHNESTGSRDMSSNFFLIGELFRDAGSFRSSMYFHKDRDSNDPKLLCGRNL